MSIDIMILGVRVFYQYIYISFFICLNSKEKLLYKKGNSKLISLISSVMRLFISQ